MKENILTIAGVIVMVLIVWASGNYFSKSIETHEIIEPINGVQCIIVSRSFNTSVDCWRKEDE